MRVMPLLMVLLAGCVSQPLPAEPPPDNCWEADVPFSYAVHDCERILGYDAEVELCDFEYSFMGGFYNFSSDTVYVARNTCLPKDYARTIQHEICHRKQYLEGKAFDELECIVGG